MVKTDLELLISLQCPPYLLKSLVGGFLVLGLTFGTLKLQAYVVSYQSTALLWDLHELIAWCKVEWDMPDFCVWRAAFVSSCTCYWKVLGERTFPLGEQIWYWHGPTLFSHSTVHEASRTYMPCPCLDLSETGWLCLTEVSNNLLIRVPVFWLLLSGCGE